MSAILLSLRRLSMRLPANKALCGLLFFAAAFAVYAPALSGEFIWDDSYLVGDNPFFKSPIFVFEVFRRYLFLDSFSLYYRPVQNLTYMVDYWLWNQNSFGYHVSNVLFHAASGFLLYLLLKRLLHPLIAAPASVSAQATKLQSDLVAFLVALTWVIHPIHNAAVAYISGRADSLASLFALGGWLIWLRGRETKSAVARLASSLVALCCCLLALCSKEIAFVWIVLFSLHLSLFDSRAWRKKAAIIGSLLLVVSIYWVLRHLPGPRTAPLGDAPAPLAARVILMLRALGDYAGLMLFPRTLHMERILFVSNAYSSARNWASNISYEYLSLLGIAVLTLFTTMCVKRNAGQRLRILGALWFLIGFLPISNLFPLNAQSAEHWIYMPSIGFLLFLGGCVIAMPVRMQRWCAVAVCLAVVPLGMRTARRSQDWAHLETFLLRTIEDGGGTPRIHVNLAVALMKRNDCAGAEKILRETVRRFPEFSSARITLGLALMRQGKNTEAEPYLSYDKTGADRLAKAYPNTWKASLNLAHLRDEAGHTGEALAILDDAVARYPGVWDLVRFKASLVRKTSGPVQALKVVRSYTNNVWWDYDAHMMLGDLNVVVGNNDEAIAAFRDASRLDIHSVQPLSKLAMLKLAQKQPIEALGYQKKAIQRDPNQPVQYVMLASILEELSRPDEARLAMRSAEELSRVTASAVTSISRQ